PHPPPHPTPLIPYTTLFRSPRPMEPTEAPPEEPPEVEAKQGLPPAPPRPVEQPRPAFVAPTAEQLVQEKPSPKSIVSEEPKPASDRKSTRLNSSHVSISYAV